MSRNIIIFFIDGFTKNIIVLTRQVWLYLKKKEFLIDANTLLILAGCGSMRVSYVRGPMCVVIVSLGLCLASTGETEVYTERF